MNRKDYRKMMQKKKMNKIYSRSLILAVLGLGVSISGNTIVKAEAREWKANTSTTIKAGDTEYIIKWGDTLSLISRDSGITIETLTKLNNILDANLIFEGNTIYFGDGVSVTVKDNNGNTIAEIPLTEQDKEGIKEAQKNNTNSTNSVNTGSSSNKASNLNETGNNNSGTNASNKPNNPETDGNGSGTQKPDTKEYNVTVNYLTEAGEVLSKEVEKAKEDTIFEAKAKEFKGYELISTDTQTVKVNEDKTITFIYKKVESNKPEVEKFDVTTKFVDTEGNSLSSDKVQRVEKGTLVTSKAIDIKGYTVKGEATQSVVANSNETITFVYEKDDVHVPVHTEETVVVNLDTDGNTLTSTEGYDYVSESTDGGVTTTAPNGDTHTVYTKTVVWKKQAVTPPVTDNPYAGKQVSASDVIRGEYNGTFYEGLGDSGMVWNDQLTASMYAIHEIANGGHVGSYITWQVRMAGTNAIMWTVQFV